MRRIKGWFFENNAIFEAKSLDISSYDIVTHLVVCSKRCQSLMLILIDVNVGQVS